MDYKILNKGYSNYYNKLINTGTINKKDVYRLNITKWLLDLLDLKYNYTVSEQQYNKIKDLMYCFSGDCLLLYDTYCNSDNININKTHISPIPPTPPDPPIPPTEMYVYYGATNDTNYLDNIVSYSRVLFNHGMSIPITDPGKIRFVAYHENVNIVSWIENTFGTGIDYTNYTGQIVINGENYKVSFYKTIGVQNNEHKIILN